MRTRCAADARGAKVDVTGARHDQPARGVGPGDRRWQASTASDPAIAVPQIQATRVTAIGRPENPYE